MLFRAGGGAASPGRMEFSDGPIRLISEDSKSENKRDASLRDAPLRAGAGAHKMVMSDQQFGK